MSAPTISMPPIPPGPYAPQAYPPFGSSSPTLASLPKLPIYRLSVEQYHQMLEAGILKDGERVELLRGCLVQKMTINPPHITALGLAHDAILDILPRKWVYREQGPITFRDSEPEPDIAILRGRRRDYANRHPRPAEVALIVEVSDSSLDVDQEVKLADYAAVRIPVYVIVNLIGGGIEVYSDPDGVTYNTAICYLPGAEVPVIIDGHEVGRIPVNELLP